MESMMIRQTQPRRPSIGRRPISILTRSSNIIGGKNCGTNWVWILNTVSPSVTKMKKSLRYTTKPENKFGGTATSGLSTTQENHDEFWQTYTSQRLHVARSTRPLSQVQCDLHR